jgi:multidrug efflux pump subunit AcrA (membrane-fusion protein)
MTKGEKKIYDSMTVTVTIITEKKSNTLIIPSTAIQVDSGNRIVQIMKGTEIIEKKVVVGIKDAINTEILSGLILGEQILTQRYISPDQKMVTKTGKFERPNVNGLGV